MTQRPPDVKGYTDQLRGLGMADDDIALALADVGGVDEFEMLPETADALNLFSVCASQWRMRQVPVGMGASISRPYGLDYTACESIVRLRGLSFLPETWAHLQILEQALIENGDSSR